MLASLARGRVGLDRGRVRWTQFLDAQASEPLANVDGGLKALALDDTGDETACESVTSAVGVDDLRRVNGMDWLFLDLDIAALLRYG